MMLRYKIIAMGLLLNALLTACSNAGLSGNRVAVGNLYDFPVSHPAVMDNDSYYTQPNTYQPSNYNYKGCINTSEGPSCGGG